ncbi:hypothetical protein FQA39_LY11323 [Lamprigera yunnana]|nr:hypothetical protein FQA39_LY11323 [Lamprigera yunnana]
MISRATNADKTETEVPPSTGKQNACYIVEVQVENPYKCIRVHAKDVKQAPPTSANYEKIRPQKGPQTGGKRTAHPDKQSIPKDKPERNGTNCKPQSRAPMTTEGRQEDQTVAAKKLHTARKENTPPIYLTHRQATPTRKKTSDRQPPRDIPSTPRTPECLKIKRISAEATTVPVVHRLNLETTPIRGPPTELPPTQRTPEPLKTLRRLQDAVTVPVKYPSVTDIPEAPKRKKHCGPASKKRRNERRV